MDYVFMTDSDSDLPYDLKVKYDIPVVYMPYALNGKEYFDDLGQSLDHKSYYDAMRNGAVAVTSALNKQAYLDYFEPILKEKDLLFVAFSSQMSMTIREVYAAREELLKKYPERKFIVVDTLSISCPMALLVLKAHEMYRAGAPIEEVADWIEKNRMRANGYFTVDDLKYLRRGGRISTAAATMGTMLDLKPIIMENREGKLVSVDKVRGRKKALQLHGGEPVEGIEDPTETIAFVLHATRPRRRTAEGDMLVGKDPGHRDPHRPHRPGDRRPLRPRHPGGLLHGQGRGPCNSPNHENPGAVWFRGFCCAFIERCAVPDHPCDLIRQRLAALPPSPEGKAFGVRAVRTKKNPGRSREPLKRLSPQAIAREPCRAVLQALRLSGRPTGHHHSRKRRTRCRYRD